eukprot:CFRG1554T1
MSLYFFVYCILIYTRTTYAFRKSTSAPVDIDILDIVVVGGGTGGTYSAWRLATSESTKSLNIALFEATDRIGGRLYSPLLSEDLCGNDETASRSELGGMRLRKGKYMDPLVNNVLDVLNIKTGVFGMNNYDNSTTDDVKNFRRLRGSVYKNSEIQNDTKAKNLQFPYVLTENERNLRLKGDNMSTNALDMIQEPMPRTITLGVDNLCDGKQNSLLLEQEYGNGVSYYDFSLEGSILAKPTGSLEEFRFLQDFHGYSYLPSENVLMDNAIHLATNTSETGYLRPLEGMQKIPQTLASKFEETNTSIAQKTIRMNHRLLTVEHNSDSFIDAKYKLTFVFTQTSECTGVSVNTNKTHTVYADRLILALPKAPLQRIVMNISTDVLIRTEWERKIDLVDGNMAIKIALGWRQPWWKNQHPDYKAGRVITSSPLRQVFSWYPGTQSLESTCKEKNFSTLLVYADGTSNLYWRQYLNNRVEMSRCPISTPANKCDIEQCYPADQFLSGKDRKRYNKHMNDAVKRQLSDLFNIPVADIPDPDAAQAMLWDPSNHISRTYAWHAWRPGQRFWELYEDMLQPFGNNEAVHVVGEAYSMNQGWSEGAMMTVENLLQGVMGVEPAIGLTREVYCAANPYWQNSRVF